MRAQQHILRSRHPSLSMALYLEASQDLAAPLAYLLLNGRRSRGYENITASLPTFNFITKLCPFVIKASLLKLTLFEIKTLLFYLDIPDNSTFPYGPSQFVNKALP